MKSLLKIVLGGFAVFMVLAIAQEWEFFRAAWFGSNDSEDEVTEDQYRGAEQAVRETLALMRHFYSSNGDRRYLERMPVSDGAREEILADVRYLSRNHRRQDSALLRLEVVTTTSLGRDRIEVVTREFWKVAWHSIVDGEPTDEPRWQIIRGRYLTTFSGARWQVDGWDFILDEADDEGVDGA